MFIDRTRSPFDLPRPATPDEVAAGFPTRLFTIVQQPAIEEAGVSVTGSNTGGRQTLAEVSLSYTLWRNPADRDDPVNLEPLGDELSRMLEEPPTTRLPQWIVEWRQRMRYPLLWEAVRTTHTFVPQARRTLEAHLVQHANYVLTNQFRDERVRGEFPGELVDPVSERCVEREIPIELDGTEVAGVRIDTDPNVFALGLETPDRMLTAVFSRDHLGSMRLAFATRA
jgi:hypothetical protein